MFWRKGKGGEIAIEARPGACCSDHYLASSANRAANLLKGGRVPFSERSLGGWAVTPPKAAGLFASLLGCALYDRTLLGGPSTGGCDHWAAALLLLHQAGRIVLGVLSLPMDPGPLFMPVFPRILVCRRLDSWPLQGEEASGSFLPLLATSGAYQAG